jgi:hypothetical protein
MERISVMNSDLLTGGCLCGAVRYTIRGDPIAALNCHCSDCRHASGAPFVTWAVFPHDALAWGAGKPHAISWAERTRLFCHKCGTPLAVLPPEHMGIVAITACSLDHPELIRPTCHTWTEDRLPWIHCTDDLPSYEHAATQATSHDGDPLAVASVPNDAIAN